MAETVEDAIRAEVAALAPDFVTIRHVLHQNPELSDREEGTAKLVADSLAAAGIISSVARGLGDGSNTPREESGWFYSPTMVPITPISF